VTERRELERFVDVTGSGRRLHGVLHEGGERGAIVVCHGFAEEKKCAHRVLVDLARRLAADGWSVLRFDLGGCGESDGDFGEQALAQWQEDVAIAADFARQECGRDGAVLCGLRLGATLAAQVAETRDDIQALVLWEPIVDGARYIQLNLRRSLIKKQMTEVEGGQAKAEAGTPSAPVAEGEIDFDGYRVSQELSDEISGVHLDANPRTYPGPVYIASITAREEPSKAAAALGEAYAQATVVGVREQPFWNTIGIVEPAGLIEMTADWLRALGPA
jgi:exosortase A-associated hydrolase 2